MEKKKSKLPLNKILTISTVVLPTFVYLIINALFFSVTPDVTFHDVEITDLKVITQQDDTYFVYAEKVDYSVDGTLVRVLDDKLGVVIDKETIINIGFKYYNYDLVKTENEDGTTLEEMKFVNVKVELLKEKTSKTIPITIIIGMVGVAIASLIVFKKMHYALRYPRVSVLIALSIITGVLYLIDMVVGSLLSVFLVFTISWVIYMIEYAVLNGNVAEKEAQKFQSKLMQELARASQMFK